MRRVFPLRPAETSLLVTYDNGAFELPNARPSAPSASCDVKKSRRRSKSTDFSAPSSSSSPPAVPPGEFADAGSPSPRSSLWTSGVLDDGDSASFNSSFQARRRHASQFSSSSSSSINFNPADTVSSFPISPCKDVDTRLDNKASSRDAAAEYSNNEDDDFKLNLRVKTRNLESEPLVREPSIDNFPVGKSQELCQAETPTYVIPRQVEEYMQQCVDKPISGRQPRRAVSTLKGPDRVSEPQIYTGGKNPRRAPPKPPKQEKDEKCSCSVPFKCITKFLKRDKKRIPADKDESRRQLNLPTQFSTSLNGLYNPLTALEAKTQLSIQTGKKSHNNGAESRGMEEHCNDLSTKAQFSTSAPVWRVTPLSNNPRCNASKVGEDMPTSDDSWESSSMCKSFGSAMVNDYLQNLQDRSFRKNPRSVSYHYESDRGSRPGHRSRMSSIDFMVDTAELLQQDAKAGLHKPAVQRLDMGFAKGVGKKPNSMDMSANDVRREKTSLSKAGKGSSDAEWKWTSELHKAQENNMHSLALLKCEMNKLCKEKKILATELAAEMNARHCQRKSAENAVREMEAEMEEKLISVERDHALAKANLQKEMDRRAEEWCAKLRKIRVEEKRLRERVTKMALERVELQKTVAFHKSREACLQATAKDHELSAQTWMQRHHQAEEEVLLLRKSLTNACNKLGDREHELDLLLQTSRALERENVTLCHEFGSLRKAYKNQEVMFRNMLQRLAAVVNGPSDSKAESLRKLRGELKSFAVEEQALRNEIDALQSQLLQTKQRVLTNAEGSNLVSGSTKSSPKDLLRFLSTSMGKSSESREDLINKMEYTRQHAQQVERQLEIKEEEVGLLQSALKERQMAVRDVQDELTSVKAQRDCLHKQVQQMNQEVFRLNEGLAQLRQVVERLDDELMLKEGEISILRNTCSESEFCE